MAHAGTACDILKDFPKVNIFDAQLNLSDPVSNIHPKIIELC